MLCCEGLWKSLASSSLCCISCTTSAISALSDRGFHLLKLDSLFGVSTVKADQYPLNLLRKDGVRFAAVLQLYVLEALLPASPSPLLIPTMSTLSHATGRDPSKVITAVDVSLSVLFRT